MSTVDRWGMQVRREYKDKPDVEKSKDMLVIGLRGQRLPWRTIGRIMRVAHVVAYKRYNAIPEHIRKHYAETLG